MSTMSLYRVSVCLIIGTLLVSLQNVQAGPFVSRKENDLFKMKKDELPAISKDKPLDVSYHDNNEFKREIKEKLDELTKNKGALFDRILLVNRIHKRWKENYDETKESFKRNAEGVIIQNNLEHDDLYFEGDIILDEADKELMKGTAKDVEIRRKRNAIHQRKKIWTTREVPYVIAASLASNSKAVKAISAAIDIVHMKTCIRWVKYNPSFHTNYVLFIKGDGCYSKIGKNYFKKGSQDLSIGEGCEWVATVLHEMTHAMGFFHEQSRDDRNKHVKIIWGNIPVAFQDQFEVYSHGTIDKMGIEYDYNSIMHYSATAFGGGKVTIEPIDSTKSIGNSETYTSLDVVEINALYDCPTKSGYTSFSSWSRWSECDKSCYKERQSFCFHRNKAKCPDSSFYGIKTDRIKCTADECPAPVDGNWGNWAAWSSCSRSCDEGKRQRSRTCNYPAPGNNGKFCVGESKGISVCLNRRCNIGPYDVDFENGWGMWFSASDATTTWTLNTGPVKTLNTGPLGDHTLQGQGNYIYVESSRPRVKGDYARLVSKAIEFSNPQCLSFYYTMHGAMMGSLKLWIGYGGAWVELFSKSGDQGTKWLNADVTLDHNGKFQLIFQANLGGTGTSDIALDDIYIDNGACPGYVKPNITPTPTETPNQTVCEDIKKGCPGWASTGECKKNPLYMNVECKASCGLCPAKPCADDNEKCLGWASTGQCQTNTGYMKVHCKGSCGLCGDCEDIYVGKKSDCESWAKNGQCEKNSAFMMNQCKKACTGCSGPCNDTNSECPRWAKENECVRIPTWMDVNCKKSCGKC